MSEHPTVESIYAYLDGELPESEQLSLQTHLASCASCQPRLAAAQELFASIAGLPDQRLAVDLAPRVVAAIEPTARWLSPLALGQLLAALAVGVALLVGLGSATVSLRVTESVQRTGLELQAALQASLAAISDLAPDLTGLRFDLGLPAVWTVAAGALAFWVLGNGLVLRRLSRSDQR